MQAPAERRPSLSELSLGLSTRVVSSPRHTCPWNVLGIRSPGQHVCSARGRSEWFLQPIPPSTGFHVVCTVWKGTEADPRRHAPCFQRHPEAEDTLGLLAPTCFCYRALDLNIDGFVVLCRRQAVDAVAWPTSIIPLPAITSFPPVPCQCLAMSTVHGTVRRFTPRSHRMMYALQAAIQTNGNESHGRLSRLYGSSRKTLSLTLDSPPVAFGLVRAPRPISRWDQEVNSPYHVVLRDSGFHRTMYRKL